LGWEGVRHGHQWVALCYSNAAGCDTDRETGEDHSPETRLIPSLPDAALGNRLACPIY
jgi:UDP-glucose 4-epimerase